MSAVTTGSLVNNLDTVTLAVQQNVTLVVSGPQGAVINFYGSPDGGTTLIPILGTPTDGLRVAENSRVLPSGGGGAWVFSPALLGFTSFIVQAAGSQGGTTKIWLQNVPVVPPQVLTQVTSTGTSSALVSPAANFKNLLDGGDFTINPWQRNVAGIQGSAGVSASITNTVTYFPDRWFAVGGASSAMTLAKVADTAVAGFGTCCKMQRTAANANTAALNFGQVLETADSVRAQGQQVTLSFWAKQGANYSGGALTCQVASGTGTDQSAASLVAGTWTGQTAPVSQTQTFTTSFVRYSFTGTVPANCTQLGVLFQWTPSGTAGADDSVSFHGLQLEIGASATPFEHRDLEVELALCQRYAFVIPEPAAGVACGAGGVATGTNAVTFTVALPTPMRAAPTVTTAVGSFKQHLGAAASAATGLTGNATHTPTVVGLNATGTATAGQGAILEGGGGAGWILASADY